MLLEAAALGVPIAAMDTGGTSDIVRHEETGLLSKTPDALASDLARLIAEPRWPRGSGAAARAHVERTFNQAAVVDRTVALYTELVSRKQRGASRA